MVTAGFKITHSFLLLMLLASSASSTQILVYADSQHPLPALPTLEYPNPCTEADLTCTPLNHPPTIPNPTPSPDIQHVLAEFNHSHSFQMHPRCHVQLAQASKELHILFHDTIDNLFRTNKSYASAFPDIPQSIWPLLRKSWMGDVRGDYVAGRFDFSLGKRGLKMLEYNADSAGLMAESAHLQLFLPDPPRGLARFKDSLLARWRLGMRRGTLFVLYDSRDNYEEMQARFMESIAADAGWDVVRVGSDNTVDAFNGIFAIEGTKLVHLPTNKTVTHIWKTWNWSTVFESYLYRPAGLSLADVLLHPSVKVYQPLWTALLGHKTLQSLAWGMFPYRRRWLLETTLGGPSESLKRSGFVSKPGKSGANGGGGLRVHPAGVWRNLSLGEGLVYQEFYPLPRKCGSFVQVHAWMVGSDTPAASVGRLEKTHVINYLSSPIIIS
ncbi:hypothetical protein HDV05_002019 [Chytridiales sp. JEL 0842]|nr:hypothetical protein HDV05_002019 [Chytridiales sp. JEL 0842]